MFHIFDFFLTSELGHSYEYDLSVIKELHSRNIKTNLYVPVQSSGRILRELNAKPLFRSVSKYYGITKYLPSIIGKIYASIHESIMIFFDLKSIGNDCFSKEDTLFFPTINHRQILSIIWWFKNIPQNRSPRLILLFHFEENPSQRKCIFCPRMIYRIVFFIIEKYKDLNIMIATDSEELSRDYQLMIERKVHTFPIPHIKKSQPRLKRTLPCPIISYLGEARVEKGFHLLPVAIEQVISSMDFSASRFEIQVASSKQHDGVLVQETKKKLRKLSKCYNGIIHLEEKNLTGEEYHGFLLRSDILLLPYSQKAYRSRTSGIFAEGMGLGKLMVIPEKTWMDRQILAFNGIAMCFEDDNPASLADAIVRAINYFEKRDPGTLISSSERWNFFHNPEKFVDLLMSVS
ncbi:MAG: glycosyltransferase family protein [Leptospirillum sp.]